MGLVGAKTAGGGAGQLFEVEVTHPGLAQNRRHAKSGEALDISAPRRSDSVSATIGSLAALPATSVDPSEAPRAWGRSPICAWQLKVTSGSADLDLSGLSEVLFAVSYAYCRSDLVTRSLRGGIIRRGRAAML